MTNSPASSSIILMGMKHSGKSTHGARLSRLLECDFADLDEIAERAYDPRRSKSCREIYAQHGKEFFTELETRAANELAERLLRARMVAALGGGTVENEAAMELLRGRGVMVYLADSEERLFARIMETGTPAFLPPDDPRGGFSRLFARRSEAYARYAEVVIDIVGKEVEEAFAGLLSGLAESGYIEGIDARQ